MVESDRPDPQRLLEAVQAEENKKQRGKLRLFFGMSAGVGKTFAMLTAAQELKTDGVDVVVGVVETHGRSDTQVLLEGLPVIPKRPVEYKGSRLEEFDLDAVLQRRPRLVLVDELAHSNAPGSRHPKRYHDVLELLDHGIDVYSTLNVQHLESLNDVVRRITNIAVRETVPDSIIELAYQITLIDITPAALLQRLGEGKVYLGDRVKAAVDNFFKPEALTALRELSLRVTAEHVETELQHLRQSSLISGRWNTTERLLVAISHSPFSEDLIRATRRHAGAMRAPWIVLNVDDGSQLAAGDQEQLSKNIRLANELGAEVVATADSDVVKAIARIARQRDITQIIVGRPDRRFWRDLFRGGTILDRMVRLGLDIDIHVIRPQIERDPSRKRPLVKLPRLDFTSIATALMIVAVASAANWLLAPAIGYRAAGFVYLLAILFLAARSSFAAMLTAATLSALIWNFFFIPPRFTFVITAPEDIMMFLAYFVVATITGILTSRSIRQEKLLRQRETRTQVLFDFVRSLVEIEGLADLSREVDRRTQRLFQARSSLIIPDIKTGRLNRLDDDTAVEIDSSDWAVAKWVYENAKPAGWSTDTLPQVRSLCLPLNVGDERLGVMLFKPIERHDLTPDQRDLLHAINHQTAVAVQREFLQLKNRGLALLEESEKLHQTLLNSISHELRTPLTTIIGFAAALRDRKVHSDETSREVLVDEIISSADRLNHVIENLLDMSRLQSGSLRLNLEWFDTQELVRDAVEQNQAGPGSRVLNVSDPPESILIQGDFGLLLHTLSNLLRNALQYSPPETAVEIETQLVGEYVRIAVSDRGPGIPDSDLEKVFDKFHRVAGSPAGGIGLGLSLARSIVELHSGTVAAINRPGGGARFVIELPHHKRPAALGKAEP